MKLRLIALVLAAHCAAIATADIAFGKKWYEANADKHGTTLVGWKQFYMGANVAIPVTVTDAGGESVMLQPKDVIVKPGTYIDYGTPRILSEADMWETYGAPMFDVRNAGSRIDLEKDGGVWVYNNWDWEDITGVTYELERGIWPFFDKKDSNYDDVNDWLEAHANRQWVLIPTGKLPQKGTHTFTVRVSAVGAKADFAVSFTMNPDQKAKAATVFFNANGGKVSECGRVVKLNAAVGDLPVPEKRTGYKFKGWYTSKTKGTKIAASTKVTKSMTLYAQWTPRKYKVWSWSSDGSCNEYAKLTGLGKYAVGSKVTIKATPRSKDWVFGCWDWGFESEEGVSWKKLVENIQNTTLTFTMPPGNVQLVGYCLKKGEDYAPKFKFYGAEDENGTWLVRKDAKELGIYIESQSYAKLNTNKSIPAGMKLVKDVANSSGYYCQYILKVSDWSKLPKGTVKTVKLTATNRSGRKTTKSFKVIMPNKTQAVGKGVLELDTSIGYELRAGIRFNWKDLGISAAEGWTISSITGIPGLAWNAAKQKMTGVPSKAGIYAATFKVTNGRTTYVATATFEVYALPKAMVGTFYGTTKFLSQWWEHSEEAGEDIKVESYDMTKWSERVVVTVSSDGKVTAKVGSVTFSATGLTEDQKHDTYTVSMDASKETKTAVSVERLTLSISPYASSFEDAVTGRYERGGWTKDRPTGALEESYVFARKNAAATDKKAKKIAAKYAKFGKQGLIVFKNSGSEDGSAYSLGCPNCVKDGDKLTKSVFVAIDKAGKATLSGKIGGTTVSGTAYLSYEGERVYARFFSSRFVIEIEGLTTYIIKDGSLDGRVWKR
ncbi:MAG: InlB B-repeat-containing protein [Kiritimatiellae bacterium]|nr:InlB B-repeat-containing protein [Kiritimatiellia bacterium]